MAQKTQKVMGKKTAFIVLAAVIGMALLLGFVLINKGDGPVTGMILSSEAQATAQAYDDTAKTRGDVFLVVSNAFNRFEEDYRTEIPLAKDLYATVRFVECDVGTLFTARWMKDGALVFAQEGTLTTPQQGVIAYRLAGEYATVGNYTFTLYRGETKIFEKTFQIG
jgi:hypothetical protein